jgi:RNA polymerase sigma-70 factor (ECF subfamily)
MDESDIQRQLQAGQYSAAFALLLERCKERVFRLALSLLRNETHAEDATQDVFVKIWKGLPAYHGGASLSTWIYAITRNTCLTELTRRGRHPTVSLQEPAMEAASDCIPALRWADPEPGAEMDVGILLAQLPEKYRQVITLFYLEQKAYEEVASMLGLPLGTVKTLIFRAKKELLRIHAREMRTVPAAGGPPESNAKPGPVAAPSRRATECAPCRSQTNPKPAPGAAAFIGLPDTAPAPRPILL